MKGYLALLTTIGFLAVLLGLGIGVMRVVDSPAILILFGALSSNWGNIIGYYFGAAENRTQTTRKSDQPEKEPT